MMANTNRLSLIIGIATLLSVCINGLEKQCYQDSADSPGTFTLKIRAAHVAGTAEQIIALDGANGNVPSTDCKSTVSAPSNELVIKFNTAASPSAQTSPNPATSSCFVTYASPTFTVKVAVQKNPSYVQLGDTFFTVACDHSAVDAGFKEVTPIDIINGGTFNPAADRVDTVEIALVKSSDGSALTSANIGDKAKIRVTYNLDTGAIAGEYPIGLHNYDLTVAPASTSSTRTELINNAGCPSTTTNPFAIVGTYSHIAASSAPSVAGKHVFETGEFTIARFINSNQLHFKGYYKKECYALSEIKCFDQTAQCAAGRKKRAIENEVNGTYTLNINIGMPGQSDSGKLEASDDENKSKECAADKTFWIVAVVLGAVLLLVTVVTMYFFYRLRIEQRHHDKIKQKSGFENPGF